MRTYAIVVNSSLIVYIPAYYLSSDFTATFCGSSVPSLCTSVRFPRSSLVALVIKQCKTCIAPANTASCTVVVVFCNVYRNNVQNYLHSIKTQQFKRASETAWLARASGSSFTEVHCPSSRTPQAHGRAHTRPLQTRGQIHSCGCGDTRHSFFR